MDGQTLDKVLTGLAAILGEFSDSAVIGGGVALLIYRNYFILSQNNAIPEPAATKDIDMLIPRALQSGAEPLDARLSRAKFRRTMHSLETPPVEVYLGTLHDEEISIEFLTDRKSRADADQNVLVAGVAAQPLSYIEMSREAPIRFTTAQGASLQVVAPAAWIFHKALTFPRRHSREKRAKDLYGIWYAGSQLTDFSQTAVRELKRLSETKPTSWRRSAKKNLREWISGAAPVDWELLEAQDPQRLLTKAQFERFIDEDLSFS